MSNNRLFTVTFSQDDIAEIIQNLNSGKAHGHDNISIRVLKICGSAIYEPLAIIFKQCLDTSIFLSEWKKGNIVPIHKKGDKKTLKNYLPVSLLPICGKILERLMFNEMFKFFIENELILSNQSGFKPGNSCVNQHLMRPSHMRFINLLTKLMRLGVFSLTSRKHLTNLGTMVSFSN